MSSDNDLDAKLEALKTLFQEALPDRIVTRNFKDAQDRRQDELFKGVYTLLFQGVTKFGGLGAAPAGVKIFLLGQFQIEEKASGSDIESGELQMLQEVLEVVRSADKHYPSIPRLSVIDAATSAQMEHPYGWIGVVLEMNWTMKCN
jgi:predicted component of type VI protein secretion system